MIRWILVLWPSFVVAGVAETLFFTLVNPRELYLLGNVVEYSPLATYSIGFFAFWAVCAASSLLSLYLVEKPAGADAPPVRPVARGSGTPDVRRTDALHGHHHAHG
ncbi:MAG: hypothetical protein LPJ91_06660 [Pseudazoarcus pumilus]|nr:hypothetical protein [Pseudazoarcus pumilus]